MTPEQIAMAAQMWAAGRDTLDIARAVIVHSPRERGRPIHREAVIWRRLDAIKEVARALRRRSA